MDKSLLQKLIATVTKQQQLGETVKIDTRFSPYIERYEKLRNIVGFHDERVWRRYAIERIIKRKLFFSIQNKPRAEAVIEELVLAGYIGENEITEKSIEKIDAIIKKYMGVCETFKPEEFIATKGDVQKWFFSIMAVEIEETLGLLDHDEALVEAMIQELAGRLKWPAYYLEQKQEEIFTLIVAAKTLLKAKHELIAYFLIKKWYPRWFTDSDEALALAPSIWDLRKHIVKYEKHPVYKEAVKVVKPHAMSFLVFDEVVKKYHGNLEHLAQKTGTVVYEIYNTLERKVKRQVWHSFLYLLLTKLILIFIVEIPYDRWRHGESNYIQSGINLGMPVVLLLFLTIGVRVGSQENTQLFIKEVSQLFLGGESKLETSIKMPKERGLPRAISFNLLLLIGYGATYGVMIYLLQRYKFSFAGGFFFVLFITLVTYLAMRIRFTAERFKILKEKGGMGREVLYFFALPLLSSGRWLIERFSKYNVLIMIIDLFFEAPYKTLVFLFRDFSDYAREKREEIE